MKKLIKRKPFFMLLVVLSILILAPLSNEVFAADTVIQCGPNVQATLSSAGVLTISGTGDMSDFSRGTQSCFWNYRDDIMKVVVEEGVTSIGDSSFSDYYHNISDVQFSSTVRRIGVKAFYYTRGLTSINIPGTVEVIDTSAFELSNLEQLTLNEGTTTLGDSAFNYTNIKSVTIPGTVVSIGSHQFNSVNAVVIKDGVQSIKSNAFVGDVTATIYSDNVLIADNAFTRGTLYVHKNSNGEKYANSKALINLEYIKCPSGEHVWDNGEVTVKATCSKKGTKIYTCTLCDVQYTESISATGHTYVAGLKEYPSCTKKGYTPYTCSKCGNVVKKKYVAKLNHTPKSTLKKATINKKGAYEVRCRDCNKLISKQVIYGIKTINLSKNIYKYNNKAIKPCVVVKDSKGKVINKAFYTVSYLNNNKPGKGTVVIKFKGNYKGTIKKNFTIKK